MKRSIAILSFIWLISFNSSAQLKVALYPYLPRGDQFQQTLTTAWNNLHTGVTLQFVKYDCYSVDPPDSVNVFVFDGVYFNYFVSQGYLAPIDTTKISDYQKFWPFARQAVLNNKTAFGVPYLSCANVYFYRKADKALNTGTDLNLVNFFNVIGKATYSDTIPPVNQGLLMDYSGSTTDACLYVNGWMNFNQNFTTNPPLPDSFKYDQNVINRLQAYTVMAGVAQASYSDTVNNKVKWFAGGRGRSMIGITENSESFPHSFLDSIGFRLMPFVDNLPTTQNFYVDIAGVNTKTPAALQPYAAMLANLMTSYSVMYNSMIPWGGNPNPQFLIPARSNLLVDLVQVHPLYDDILKLLVNHKPFPFEFGSNSRPWLAANKSRIRAILLSPPSQGSKKLSAVSLQELEKKLSQIKERGNRINASKTK